MSNMFRHSAPAFLQIATIMLAASPCLAAWQNGFAFGSTLSGDLCTPSTLATPPAILVAIHMCTGHSSTVHGWFDSYANTNGFYIIAPDAGKQCFDASASRNGDKAAIVTMVNYLITNKGADRNRVFAAGMSSGGCMTNTLLAIYPDVFAGGSAMPGFPAGAWPAGDTSCTKCGSTPPNNTAQQWGDMARNVFSYSGTRPCSQQWVGGGDEYNFNGWLPSVALQFTNFGGLGSGTSGSGAPSGWTRTVYKDTSGNVRLETNLGPTSQKHDLETVNPPLYGNVITFLGLDKATGACGITTSVGGGSSTGGAPGTGGSKATGGTSASTGGTKASGGTSSTGGTVSSNTGGTKATTGGTNATGGTVSATGGTKATGGAASAGGTLGATGGNNATGGTLSNGGTTTNGGTLGTGGMLGNAGATLASGGVMSIGGAAGVGGSPAGAGTGVAGTGGNPSDNVGSCSCRVAGQRPSSLAGLSLLGLAVLRARRRRKAR